MINNDASGRRSADAANDRRSSTPSAAVSWALANTILDSTIDDFIGNAVLEFGGDRPSG